MIKIPSLALLLAPLIAWPLVFVVLSEIFVFAMLFATIILGTTSYFLFKDEIRKTFVRSNKLTVILVGFIASLLLYGIFYLGGYLSNYLGLGNLVSSVYDILLGIDRIALAFSLIVIGFMEEVYWRGFLQGVFLVNKSFPWLISSIYYSLVHLVTFNVILVIAALIVGLITGYIAYRFGVASSIITHVVWLQLIIVIFPILLS